MADLTGYTQTISLSRIFRPTDLEVRQWRCLHSGQVEDAGQRRLRCLACRAVLTPPEPGKGKA